MRSGYDLAALATQAGTRQASITLRPIASRRADEAALRAIIVGVVCGGSDEREAVLQAAESAQAALTQDDMGYREAVRRFRAGQQTRLQRATGALTDFVNRVSHRFDAQWMEMVRSVVGVDLKWTIHARDLQALTALVVQKIAGRIGGLSDDLANRVEAGLIQLLMQGASASDKAKAVAAAYAKGRKASARAAKMEIEALNAVLNQFRQTQAGITKYVWWTQEDERVRGRPDGLYPRSAPSHWARQSKIFAWAEPPEGGHPGEAFGCRCVARPIIELAAKQPTQPPQSRARLEGLRAVSAALGLGA